MDMNEMQLPVTNTDESHQHNIEQKKADTKDYILFDFIYNKFKNSKNYPVIVTVRVGGFPLAWGKVVVPEKERWREVFHGCWRCFMGTGNVLFLNLNADYMGGLLYRTLFSCILITCIFVHV